MNLGFNDIGDDGARAIAEAADGGAFPEVEAFDLTGNDIGLESSDILLALVTVGAFGRMTQEGLTFFSNIPSLHL